MTFGSEIGGLCAFFLVAGTYVTQQFVEHRIFAIFANRSYSNAYDPEYKKGKSEKTERFSKVKHIPLLKCNDWLAFCNCYCFSCFRSLRLKN
jgi:hypothetical protein